MEMTPNDVMMYLLGEEWGDSNTKKCPAYTPKLYYIIERESKK